MKKLKIFLLLVLLFFGGLFFISEAQAADCTEASQCNIGDVCNWPGSPGNSCGKTTDYAICVSNSASVPICTRMVGKSCDINAINACGEGLVCVNNKCTVPIACGPNKKCPDGLICDINKCIDADSESGKDVARGNEQTKSPEGMESSSKTASNVCKVDCKIGGFFKNTRKECICCGMCTPDDLMTVANTVLKWLFGIVGALGLAMFVYGGFLWVISRGDSGSIGKGKDVIKNTVVGMVIMFASGTMIMALQTALNVDESARVEITGKTQFGESSGGASDDASDAEHGDKNVGDACKVLAGEDSECKSGAYCYSTSKTKGASGVCVPLTKNRGNVKDGGDCFYMPHTDNPSMCAEGQCVTGKSNPVVGDKGVCKK